MTQQPFDPFEQPLRPVDLPRPGARQPVGYPGGMRGVDQRTTAFKRPGAVFAAFVCWLLAALAWPLGTVVRALAEDGSLGTFGGVMTLFGTGCLAVGGVCGAIAFLGGDHTARIALCGGHLVVGILAVAAVVLAARDGTAEPASWAVIVLRLVLPAAAAVLSFLPGTRHHFAGSPG
ncbi:hypothetical protein [Saccharothrix australiensis]|uniref:Uncharacterized protein n=1 Tax=Saccharothrix australiensis TaxID=2072 RepID=A0A495WAT1_9PSEU|nr:hypothetical protein [Saccharothrix australiensis]RKT57895.1 hypothetical protein C8E97_6627 [Saccharothrix australiensis]